MSNQSFRPSHLYLVSAWFLMAGWVQAADIDLKMSTTNGSTKVSYQDSGGGEVASVNSKGQITTSSNVVTTGYAQYSEMTAPGGGPADTARLYAKDVGGTTYMAYKDSAGTERLLRPQTFITMHEMETGATNLGTTYKDVHYANDASKFMSTTVDFTGYTEARIVFRVVNNEADTITCRIYNTTDSAAVCTGTSDGTTNAQTVTGSWTAVNLSGDKGIRAECIEGTGATADPDFGLVVLQLR